MNDMALTFPPELLKRHAVIYVRQSTQSQVMTNLESQRQQYDLVEMARRSGFAGIDVIDDDLSNARKLVMSWSGGFLNLLDTILECNPFDDFGESVLAVEFAPFILR